MDNIIGKAEVGISDIGSGSIKHTPYQRYNDYKSGPFPSGEVDQSIFLLGKVQWWWKPNISIIGGIEWSNSNINGEEITFNVGFDIYYPKLFKI